MNASSGVDKLRRTTAFVSCFSLVLALFAAVLIRWPDNFFADDSYFYFQVAWNIARGLGSTFNNVIPTNGYHPLWMLVCVAVFKAFPSKIAAVHAIGAVISLFDAAALMLLYRVLKRVAPGSWWVAFFVYMPFCFLTQLGTEGALSGFFLAAVALAAYRVATEPDQRAVVTFAVCGSLAVLSRLDSIFVVSLMYAAVFFAARLSVRARVRRLLLLSLPIYMLLWGAYVGSNLHWFGTVEPISGLLKSHPHGQTEKVAILPHIAIFSLLVILPSIAILARFCRDTFFRVVELPFALGVLMHAGYIVFVMSNETRWSWYYTSWVLLASILASRVMALVLAKRPEAVRQGLAAASLVVLLLVWYRVSYRKFAHAEPDAIGVGYQENLSDRLHLHTVLAFDKPGRMAYYSDVRVVALDGLMGDLQFQRDLAAKGIAAFDTAHQVDGFIGPPQPFDESARENFCDRVTLSAVKFHCVASGPGEWRADGVEVFARLTGTSAGYINLPADELVWSEPHNVAAWRLPVAASIPSR
ncbi:MAG TPA: hypothetical protein VGU46_07990 [Acidobacteriaceae bacterium]|nr:hypothetical protein [Acidobacteriaceae bacterium]